MNKTAKINGNADATTPAKAYVDRQLETMKKNGAVSALTDKEYQTLIKKVERATTK